MRELGELRAKRHVRGSGDELSSIQQFCFALERNEEKWGWRRSGDEFAVGGYLPSRFSFPMTSP